LLIIAAMETLIQADSTGSWNGWQTLGANPSLPVQDVDWREMAKLLQ